MSKSEEDIKKKVDEVLRLENWRGFVNGKVTGGLAVLDVLGIEKEKRIEILAEALGLCTATATEDKIYRNKLLAEIFGDNL